jgi:hypothetical protein
MQITSTTFCIFYFLSLISIKDGGNSYERNKSSSSRLHLSQVKPVNFVDNVWLSGNFVSDTIYLSNYSIQDFVFEEVENISTPIMGHDGSLGMGLTPQSGKIILKAST